VLVLLISAVHANLAALDAVLADPEAARTDATWHLGDLVGYGPQPNEVVARLRELGAANILGNHDAAAVGLLPTRDFNQFAAHAAAWTTDQLDESSRDYLAALPRIAATHDVTRVHGSLRDPLWEYLTTVEAAREHFARQETDLSAVGHTHIPLALSLTLSGSLTAEEPGDGETLDLTGARWCLNPGSVGQPRDSDPRAAFALLDTSQRRVTFRRVEYDIAGTQALMAAAGLPDPLVRRLQYGR